MSRKLIVPLIFAVVFDLYAASKITFNVSGGACPNSDMGGSLVFDETIRDRANSAGLDEPYVRRFVSVHETGHQFGLKEDSRGFMSNWTGLTPEPVFLNEHIRQIRSIDHPGCQ